MIGVVKAVRIGKVRVRAAQRLRARVHHINKRAFTARDQHGDGYACVVARADKERSQQRAPGHFLARVKPHQRRAVGIGVGLARYRDRRVQIAYVFKREHQRHYFGGGGGIAARGRILGIQYAPGMAVDKYRAGGRKIGAGQLLGLTGIVSQRRGRVQRHDQRQREQNRHKALARM